MNEPDGSSSGRLHYFDGETVVPHNVRLEIVGEVLKIQPDEGGLATRWAFPTIRLMNRSLDGGRLELASTDHGDARLVVENRLEVERLIAAVPDLDGPVPTHSWTRAGKVVAGLLGLCALIGVLMWQAARVLPVLLDDEYQSALGKGLANSFAEPGLCESGPGNAALSKMLDRVGGTLPDGRRPEVRIVDRDLVNAVAFPGAQILIFRGLLDMADGPDMVAGVLAHEVGHIRYRHPMRGLIRHMGITVVFEILTGGSGFSTLAGTLILLKNSRDFEVEADEYAIARLRAAGADPAALADFFKALIAKLSDTEDGEDRRADEDITAQSSDWSLNVALGSILSTHPLTSERVDRYGDLRVVGAEPVLNTEEWSALKGICGSKSETDDPEGDPGSADDRAVSGTETEAEAP